MLRYYDALPVLAVTAFALCGAIMIWLYVDHVYIISPAFRRLWARTGLPFPHTSFSPYFKRDR